jgi:hypothetical protein
MKRIEQIIITCCARDFWLTRICVASIRYWYPDIPIGLLKDPSQGRFDTTELQKYWQVEIVAEPEEMNGWWTKLHAIFLPGRQRILLLDSDTVFLGPVLAKLEAYEEDFIVHWGKQRVLNEEEKNHYAANGCFDLPALKRMFPAYEAPDYFFNAGQMVMTSGLLQVDDFSSLWAGTDPITLRFPEVFTCFDQGLLNFILAEKQRMGKASVQSCDFVKWREGRTIQSLSLKSIQRKDGYPFLFHWAGQKPYFTAGYPRGDFLHFYENYYYSRVWGGWWKKWQRLWRRHQEAFSPRVKRLWKMQGKPISFFHLLRAEWTQDPLGAPEAFVGKANRPIVGSFGRPS